jgi:hypothetical protein
MLRIIQDTTASGFEVGVEEGEHSPPGIPGTLAFAARAAPSDPHPSLSHPGPETIILGHYRD